METPNNLAGRMTELAMARWLGKLDRMIPKEPRPSTTIYNAAYEAVYDTLRDLETVKKL